MFSLVSVICSGKGANVTHDSLDLTVRWLGLQWRPSVVSRWGGGGGWGPYTLRSNASWVMVMDTPLWTYRHEWIHYLPATSLAVGNNVCKKTLIQSCRDEILKFSMIFLYFILLNFLNFRYLKLIKQLFLFDLEKYLWTLDRFFASYNQVFFKMKIFSSN